MSNFNDSNHKELSNKIQKFANECQDEYELKFIVSNEFSFASGNTMLRYFAFFETKLPNQSFDIWCFQMYDKTKSISKFSILQSYESLQFFAQCFSLAEKEQKELMLKHLSILQSFEHIDN